MKIILTKHLIYYIAIMDDGDNNGEIVAYFT